MVIRRPPPEAGFARREANSGCLAKDAKKGAHGGNMVSPVTLLGVPGSHPALAAELMLRRKGIPYRRRDLPNMSQRFVLPLLRLPARTVPVVFADGLRVQGTMRI